MIKTLKTHPVFLTVPFVVHSMTIENPFAKLSGDSIDLAGWGVTKKIPTVPMPSILRPKFSIFVQLATPSGYLQGLAVFSIVVQLAMPSGYLQGVAIPTGHLYRTFL